MSRLFAKGLSEEYIFIQFRIRTDITSIQISTVRNTDSYDEDWDYSLCTDDSSARGIYT